MPGKTTQQFVYFSRVPLTSISILAKEISISLTSQFVHKASSTKCWQSCFHRQNSNPSNRITGKNIYWASLFTHAESDRSMPWNEGSQSDSLQQPKIAAWKKNAKMPWDSSWLCISDRNHWHILGKYKKLDRYPVGGGGGILPHISYIGTFCPSGYHFQGSLS